jgi:hypothetical protein
MIIAILPTELFCPRNSYASRSNRAKSASARSNGVESVQDLEHKRARFLKQQREEKRLGTAKRQTGKKCAQRNRHHAGSPTGMRVVWLPQSLPAIPLQLATAPRRESLSGRFNRSVFQAIPQEIAVINSAKQSLTPRQSGGTVFAVWRA